MSDDLLQYYHRELSFLRKSGAAFAVRHPDVAGQLRLEQEHCDDPHVERLLEGFAYLAARIRRKIDDDFPLIAEALLNVLYPHYTAPTPSMAIAQINLDPSHDSSFDVASDTLLETDPVRGMSIKFRTCYPVELWPIRVTQAEMGPIELSLPNFVPPPDSAAMIRLRLTGFTKDILFSKLAMPKLRFFLAGQRQHTNRLYELLLNHVTGVAVFDPKTRATPRMLAAGAIRPVGFARDENVLPDSGRQFPGYRLLSEYFAFPDKFLFVDVVNLGQDAVEGIGNEMELFIFLDQTAADLQQNLGPSMFPAGLHADDQPVQAEG
jgi:type VI secretion system protein ImpG